MSWSRVQIVRVLTDALRWLAFIALLLWVYPWWGHKTAPFASQVGPWREIASLAEAGDSASESASQWMQQPANLARELAGTEMARSEALSPQGDRVRKALNYSSNRNAPACDLMFSRAGSFSRELRLLRLGDEEAAAGADFQWKWSEDGKQLFVRALGKTPEPLLIVYNIQQNEILRVRPETRQEVQAKD